MVKILVTGGAGFIGSHMIAKLLANGHDVVSIDNLSSGHRDAVLGGEFHRIDINDSYGLEALFERHDFDAVAHFAASIEAGISVVKPLEFYRNNVGGTLSLLMAMARHDVKRIVFSSTAAVYSTDAPQPLTEQSPVCPSNP